MVSRRVGGAPWKLGSRRRVALLIDDDAEAPEEARKEARKEARGAEHLGLTRRRRRELAVAGPYVVTEGLLGGRS